VQREPFGGGHRVYPPRAAEVVRRIDPSPSWHVSRKGTPVARSLVGSLSCSNRRNVPMRFSRWLLLVTTARMLAGCTTRETVMMQHPQTHELVRCAEGYRSFIDGKGYRRQEDCIAELERKGFERSPATPAR
jgi:hypothetical protein